MAACAERAERAKGIEDLVRCIQRMGLNSVLRAEPLCSGYLPMVREEGGVLCTARYMLIDKQYGEYCPGENCCAKTTRPRL